MLPAGVRGAWPCTYRDGLQVASVAIDQEWLPLPAADLVAATLPREQDHCLTLLPDDAVFASTPYEAEIVAAELMSSNGYLHASWTIPPRPTVLDVGAHIGLFTLDVVRRHPGARVVAVEPFGPSYAALIKNIRLHGYENAVEIVNAAVSDRSGSTVVSGCRGAALLASAAGGDSLLLNRTRETLLGSVPRLLGRGSWTGEVTEWAAAGAIGRLFDRESNHVPCCTVTELMTRYHLRRVSLLKIDVEGHEARVLDGISAEAWAAIDAVALETTRDRLSDVCARLACQGFQPAISESAMTTRAFGHESLIVRARRGPPPVVKSPSDRPLGRFGTAVSTIIGLRETARRIGRQFWPRGHVLVDACVGDPGTAPGPLFLPWSTGGVPTRSLSHGDRWARHFLDRYAPNRGPGRPDLGERLTRVFGGDWASLTGLSAEPPVGAAVGARLAADQLIHNLVRSTLHHAEALDGTA